MRTFTCLLPLLLLAAPLPAQQDGVTELSRIDEYSYHNDVWGYTAPDGREYAIVGTSSGTAFYNVSTPTAPYRTGFINGPSSIWRDMKTLGDYCYIVTEGGGGVQIVDLSDPENPNLITTWGANIWSHAHNIFIDTGASMAYIIGADPGMPVLDLSNPTAPVRVATYGAREVHDAYVANGLAHLAELHDGHYRIVSVANLPSFPTQDSVTTPGDFTHNVWVNDSDTIAVTTDESTGGGLSFYDVSNPSNIQLLSTWDNNNATVHNAFIKGDLVYASWYSFGFAVIDISDPANPQQIARFDSSPANSGTGYDGTWGCYPFAASGLIYLSDQDRGLSILRIDGQAMKLSGPGSITAGGNLNLSISGAPANSTWYLLFSDSNGGSTLFGQAFEVGASYQLVASGLTDANGDASQSLHVPAGASGRIGFLEAATANGGVRNSTLLRVEVL